MDNIHIDSYVYYNVHLLLQSCNFFAPWGPSLVVVSSIEKRKKLVLIDKGKGF